MLDEADFSIQLERHSILPHNFQMQRANSCCSRPVFHEFHRLPSPPSPAILFAQIELVDERVPPQPLQAIAKAQNDVADCNVAIQNQPGTPKTRIAKQCGDRRLCLLTIEAMPVERVVRPHEFEKNLDVGFRCQTKLWLGTHTTFSSATAIPIPPLTQRVATPRWVLRFSISCNSVTVILVPVHPIGCPSAIAPPFTLSRSRLMFSARSQASTCAANASFNSISPNSCSRSPCFSSSFRSAGTGPIPTARGSPPAAATAAIRARGLRLFSFTKFSLATTVAAAPSVIPEEFPAEMVPVFENTGGSFASFSRLASGKGCSSRLNVVVPFFPSMVTGASSASNRPAAIARAA